MAVAPVAEVEAAVATAPDDGGGSDMLKLLDKQAKAAVSLVKSLLEEGYALLWTVSGTALVLITLSGEVLKYALWISGISLLTHLVGFILMKDVDEDDQKDD